jgi:DNA repair exonuclease SbcCD ATPase subunit
MSTKSAIVELEERIDHFYESHSVKRVAVAALVVGVVSVGICWATYNFTMNAYLATGAFAVTSLLMVNLVMFAIVPRTQRLAESKERLVGALKDPSRISSAEKNKVALLDAAGKTWKLNRLEQAVWESIVVPHLLRSNSGMGLSVSAQPQEVVPSSEMSDERVSNVQKKIMEKRQAELIANRDELLSERKKLDEERAALNTRAKELRKMQDKLENRVSRVEASEMDVARLKENLRRRKQESQHVEMDSAEHAMLEQKAAELKAKELELESAKQALATDRDQLEAKKLQLEGLQESVSDTVQSSDLIDSKARELEEREAELEERLQYVANVENDLIDRLNQLSEREAEVEQTEVEAGIRKD